MRKAPELSGRRREEEVVDIGVLGSWGWHPEDRKEKEERGLSERVLAANVMGGYGRMG